VGTIGFDATTLPQGCADRMFVILLNVYVFHRRECWALAVRRASTVRNEKAQRVVFATAFSRMPSCDSYLRPFDFPRAFDYSLYFSTT
jgi:hypothetical protein